MPLGSLPLTRARSSFFCSYYFLVEEESFTLLFLTILEVFGGQPKNVLLESCAIVQTFMPIRMASLELDWLGHGARCPLPPVLSLDLTAPLPLSSGQAPSTGRGLQYGTHRN
ncbi:hypothetical protein RRG08_046751 [Elysia crispata]|uniref:Uncharacterized protein n=1 Tax=Elysia crispata TaxID=231223 RepID=A0AAE1DMI4_9GAST|nr:hypothetical protein RRG08_046751 [Elysia crispata]